MISVVSVSMSFFSQEEFLNFLSKLNHPAVISDYNVLFSSRICDTY